MKRFFLIVFLLFFALSAKAENNNFIDFRLVHDDAVSGTKTVFFKKTGKELFIEQQPCLSISDIDKASVEIMPATVSPKEYNSNSGPKPSISVRLKFTDNGAKKISEITSNNIGKRLAILIDGDILTAPRIMEEISSGELMLLGNFTEEEANSIAERINNK